MRTIRLTKKRINELGSLLADYANENIEGIQSKRDSNYLLGMLDEAYLPFINYAASNELLCDGEKQALERNNSLLDCYIKEVAIEEIQEAIDANA